MDFALTFLEGIASFVSPCLLPMVPLYLAYVAGDGGQEGEGRSRLVGACGFVAGFGVVFTLMGAFAGTLGSFLLAHRRAIDLVCGALVIAMGLVQLGVVKLPGNGAPSLMGKALGVRGIAGSVAFGAAFALSWTPCVGAYLAAALATAARAGGVGRGMALLACYSLGLGLPFVLVALLMDQLEGALSWMREHSVAISRACGVLLVAFGTLMSTGHLGALLGMLAM